MAASRAAWQTDAVLRSDVIGILRRAGCVFAEDEARILVEAAVSPEQLGDMVERRARGIPLEHVVGWVEFCGLRVSVDTDVFVPRQRSQLVVAAAARLVKPGAVVLDLCCGCGALGLALATECAVELHAADVSEPAVECARRNLAPLGGTVYRGDLFNAVPVGLRGGFDLVICNAPYVPTGMIGTLPPEARLHEPLGTLDGGADGLDVVRRVASDAPHWLRVGGHLIVESSEVQAPAMCAMFERAGLAARTERDNALGATVVVGRLSSRS